MRKAIHHRDEFGAELFLQLIYLLRQRLGLFCIFHLIGSHRLTREIENLAIGLFLPCHWRWCRRRFVHRPLTWRRSVVDVAHRAALSKSGKSQRSGARSNGAFALASFTAWGR